MHLTAKVTMNCLQHINLKCLTSALSRCHLQITFKRSSSSAQKLYGSSKPISKLEQNSLTRNRNSTTCVKNKLEFAGDTLPAHFSKKFSSVAEKAVIQKNISALQVKKRIPRKKSTLDTELHLGKNKWLVVAYSSAEEYDLPAAKMEIQKQGVYKILPLPKDAEVLHVVANYPVQNEPRHIFFFSEGSVVFWNVPDLEQLSVLEFLKPFQVNSYDENVFKEEKDDLEYLYGENGTKLSNGLIVLNEGSDIESLEKYAFAHGMALSVKLAIWEATLESFVDSIEWVTENMKYGKKVKMSREQVFQKRGELFALRHVINLSSDLLDTPDFYWNRQDLEDLYQMTFKYLNIAKRTKVMNERLNYCSELIDLLGNHMNDKHHVRLELMIIALIMIEVMFECAHFISRVFQE